MGSTLCLAFVFIPYIVADANAETASARLDWSKITLELDTGSNSGNVAFNGGDAIIPDEPGKVSAEQKTLTVNTTGKHFNVYLSMDSSVGRNNKLCYDFDANDTEKNTCTHTGMGVNPVAEDSGAPASLTGNDWGYALNDGESGFSSAGTYAKGKEDALSERGSGYSTRLIQIKCSSEPHHICINRFWNHSETRLALRSPRYCMPFQKPNYPYF